MLKNKNKKKKGFTLIELVIVLAVLAIIALIAIPNFTKVRNESLKKSDIESCNQIKKITLMAIANGDVDSASGTINVANGAATSSTNLIKNKESFEDYLKEIKKPQYDKKETFTITVKGDGSVEVETGANGVTSAATK